MDDAVISMSSRLLTREIQLLTGRRAFNGSFFKYTPADTTEGWYYKLTLVDTTSADLIAGSYFQKKGTAIDSATATATVHVDDKVKFLWVYNTGTTDGTNASTDSIYLNFDDSAATNGGKNMFEIPSTQCWFCRTPSTLVGEIHAITGAANSGGIGSGNVQCIIAAILDDVA